jgi:hypothetical protein
LVLGGLADLDGCALVLADLNLVTNPWTAFLILLNLVTLMTQSVAEQKVTLSTEPTSTFDESDALLLIP